MRRRTLLVVEDDTDLRRLYRTTLAMAGFDVTEAADALEALRQLDGSMPPDLILLDLGMPVITGHAVAQEVAAHPHLRHIPVMIVTGSTEQLDYLNVACVLRKPVPLDDLTDAVRRCVGGPSRPRTAV